uniref:Caspase domain-containing protein n=1 Tax=Candidatus Kentrum sp. FW TaxID=2126338 RepID=A0A450SSN7_9GAMM|nr:MAG: Caspase domain-containing protein [Candidatus Kentron sp. FW]
MNEKTDIFWKTGTCEKAITQWIVSVLFLSIFLPVPFSTVRADLGPATILDDCPLVSDPIAVSDFPSPGYYQPYLQAAVDGLLAGETTRTIEDRRRLAADFIRNYCGLKRFPDNKIPSAVTALFTEELVRRLIGLGLVESVPEAEKARLLSAGVALGVLKEDDPLRVEAIRKQSIIALKRNLVDGEFRDAASAFGDLVRMIRKQVKSEDPDDGKQPAVVLNTLSALLKGEKIDLRAAAREFPLAFHEPLFSFSAFKDLNALENTCASGSPSAGKKRALLIGNKNYRKSPLSGPHNDIQLLKSALESRGFKDDDGDKKDGSDEKKDNGENKNITLLKDATRREMIAAMDGLARDAGCGDFVLLHFSGHAGEINTWGRGLPGWEIGLLGVDHREDSPRAILGAEISQWITAIRNRRGSVVVVIDASHAAGLSLQDFQDLAQPIRSTDWSARVTEGVTKDKPLEIRDRIDRRKQLVSILPLGARSGEFAALYGADRASHAGEEKSSTGVDTQSFGFFSYALARSLYAGQEATIAEVSQSIAREYQSSGLFGRPVFEASDSELGFGALSKGAEELELTLISPSPDKEDVDCGEDKECREKMRGVAPVAVINESEIELIARLTKPERYNAVLVEKTPVTPDETGRFETKVTLEDGKNTVLISGVRGSGQMDTKRLTFHYHRNLGVLLSEGERYALVIGIKDYQDDAHFPDLGTPIEDAKAVAEVLGEKYGFRLKLDSDEGNSEKSSTELLMTNAGERKIKATLTRLRDKLTKNDSLLIYFAGHGVINKTTEEAFWIAADSESGEEYTYISSSFLNSQLQQMQARKVLVVADSCYSGKMLRSASEKEPSDKKQESRENVLLKSAVKRSRILISSGGVEPVLDGGGSGHSIFARAFLDGLKQSEHDRFESHELFWKGIRDPVHGQTNQEPQHTKLYGSKHQGGDFVFSREE